MPIVTTALCTQPTTQSPCSTQGKTNGQRKYGARVQQSTILPQRHMYSGIVAKCTKAIKSHKINPTQKQSVLHTLSHVGAQSVDLEAQQWQLETGKSGEDEICQGQVRLGLIRVHVQNLLICTTNSYYTFWKIQSQVWCSGFVIPLLGKLR